MDNKLRELNEFGYTILHNYFDKELCNTIKKQIDNIIKNVDKSMIKFKYGMPKDGLFIQYPPMRENMGGDIRVFGFEKISNKLLNDKFIFDIVNQYSKNFSQEIFKCCSIAGKLEYDSNFTKNSGGNWHRDSDFFEIKVILYLSDVNKDNGPFQIFPNTKKQDIRDNFSNTRIGKNYPEYINKNINNKKDILGSAGTVIIANTANIHRGMPIKSGFRYSLTNYYMPSLSHVTSFKNQFKI